MNPIPNDAALRAAAETVAGLLRDHGKILATAESCTGGWIAKQLTDITGSSDWFVGGAVTYGNPLKQALLGVTDATLAQHGAVSRECALEMVSGALQRFGASVAVAVTGIAGPSGGTPDKPVGTVWIAWQRHGEAARSGVFRFQGDRDAVRRQAVAAALDGVRKSLTV
ncbi:MAG: CinA family protein [Rhodanobacteraceae bacterium]|nr:MAG: CinA family protein [Rhodanobacteraceae bacterium]